MIHFSSVEIRIQDQLSFVTLSRPEVHNAFDQRMIAELTEVFRTIGKRGDVRAVILTGKGRTFCAGADLTMMQAAAEYDFEQNVSEGESIFNLMMAINTCPQPVIGRINGSAIGGGAGIVSCCDIVIAVDRAKFAFSETRLGLVPAVISPFVIAKVGQTNTRELFLTGERFDAYHAQRIGLVHHVVNEQDLDGAIDERSAELKKAAPEAQAAAKKIIQDSLSLHNPDTGRELAAIIAKRRASAEGKEGMNAFLDKRPPFWQEESE